MYAIDAKKMPPISTFRERFGSVAIRDVPIPHDCLDGFLGADWRRPEDHLRPEVRNGISIFSWLEDLEVGLERLRLDLGYRLVVA